MTSGKLTRFNFLKTKKHNTTSNYVLPSTIQLYPNILRPNRIPCPERGIKMRHTKVNAEDQSSSRGHKSSIQTHSKAFRFSLLKVFYRKFFKIISSQTPGFFNDTQLHDICFHPKGMQSNFYLSLLVA